MKLKLKRTSTQSGNKWKVYNTTLNQSINQSTLLKDKTKQYEFRIKGLNNRFRALEKLIEQETVDEKWKVIEKVVTSSCRQVLGPKKYSHKDWITTRIPWER